MTGDGDPGWRPSLRVIGWLAIPLVGVFMRIRRERREPNQLVILRTTFLGLVTALFLFLIAFRFIAPWDGGDEGWIPWTVAAIGALSLLGVARIRRRPLDTASPEALAGSYRASFFIGVGFAETSALWGAVGMFVGGSLWLYLSGLAFGLVGLWMIAPTKEDIERRQREITEARSPLSLVDALVSVRPPGWNRPD